MDEQKIPVIIGITGHRDIRPEDEPAIRESVRAELKKIADRCPNSPVKVLCALARGGDTVCAQEALSLGLTVNAVIPFEKEIYEKDFSEEELPVFRELIGKCSTVFVSPEAEYPEKAGENTGKDYFYRQNSIYVATHAHVLIALWDGVCRDGKGCGTSSAVGFALSGAYSPKEGIPARNSEFAEVVHIFTPRGEACEGTAGTVKYLGSRETAESVMAETDSFNALPDCGALPSEPYSGVYVKADRLSVSNAKRYNRILKVFAVAGSLVSFSFMLYNELNLKYMLVVCGLILLASRIWLRAAGNLRCHRRYIEMRALAETVRVRDFLRYAGSSTPVSLLMPFSQRKQYPWIVYAVDAMDACRAPREKHAIRDCWIGDQLIYHRSASKKSGKALEFGKHLLKWAKTLTFLVYLLAVVNEFVIAGRFSFDTVIVKKILKVLLGTFSATSLFISGYHGKVSNRREQDDHVMMAEFYEAMYMQAEANGEDAEFLCNLAREELTENGDWVSYKKDAAPAVSL